MAQKEPPTSPLGRMLKLGGLMSRVGGSVLGARVLDIGRPADEQRRRRVENLTRNAARVVETLGEMKGAAMKLGQMLSLHEGLVPPEVSEVLRKLQSRAPSVPFEVMQAEVRSEIRGFDSLFQSLEPQAFAAASIGQVHRGRLRDGRQVAVKIQYPEIETIVRADLSNLRRVMQGLFALVSDADFEPVWSEVRERLLEELDYGHEADNARLMARLHADVPQVVVPGVIDEASTRRVLTMEYVAGFSAEQACSTGYSQELRDEWGRALFELVFRGLFLHRVLHADPNLANFAFLEGGRIVVYDFGCLKRVPSAIAEGYAGLVRAGLEGRKEEVPRLLLAMGVLDEAGGPLGRDLTDPYFDLVSQIFRSAPMYRFGENPSLYETLFELGLNNWAQQLDVRFPRDVVFVQRTLAGHFGNLCRLSAAADWREIAARFV